MIVYLCSLKNGLGLQIFVVTGVLDVCLNPTNVFTAAEAPFFQTL